MTDANLVLGRLPDGAVLGGEVRLDRRARRARAFDRLGDGRSTRGGRAA